MIQSRKRKRTASPSSPNNKTVRMTPVKSSPKKYGISNSMLKLLDDTGQDYYNEICVRHDQSTDECKQELQDKIKLLETYKTFWKKMIDKNKKPDEETARKINEFIHKCKHDEFFKNNDKKCELFREIHDHMRNKMDVVGGRRTRKNKTKKNNKKNNRV